MFKKLFCFILILSIILGFPVAVQAEDLPIDADTIGAGRHESPFRVRHNIDLFSESSQRLERSMVRQMQIERAEMEAGLFNAPQENQMVDFDLRVRDVTADYALFVEPVIFNRILRAEPEARNVPVWLIVFLFIFCAGSGFVLARVITQKREQKKNVYRTNN